MKLLCLISHGLAVALGVVCLPLVTAAQGTNTCIPKISARDSGEKLVDAIILVESQGNTQRVGSMGERGLMQIRLATWREVTRNIFGRPQPFQKAFDGALNRRVGSAYLAQIQTQLGQHRTAWQSDERTLLIAAYNAGPTLLAQKNYDLKKLPASTRDYVERVTNLHDAMLAELARAEQQRQAAARVALRVPALPRVATL
ncbi:MAG: lytic transglycosylase domain-containing protein [Kiritimatiellaeota bacterium]|nr:lytic transglycosylase domain-containing protein [Kiritimatiellota bacterium]